MKDKIMNDFELRRAEFYRDKKRAKRKFRQLAAVVVAVASLAIIGAVWVVIEAVRLFMPVLVFIDFVGR